MFWSQVANVKLILSLKSRANLFDESSDKIESILGYINESNLIHRNNLVITLSNREKKWVKKE